MRFVSLPKYENMFRLFENLLNFLRDGAGINEERRISQMTEEKVGMRFVELADIVYILLKSYLSKADFLQLMNTSKRYFQDLRKSVLYIRLDSLNSERFCNDKAFMDYILSRVTHPDRQISLILSNDSVRKYAHLLFVHRIRITSDNDYPIPFLPANGVTLGWSLSSPDLTPLSHLQWVALSGCKGVRDISPLKNVKEVSIFRCENIRDFSSLGKQETLHLYYCPNLKSVMNFSGIQKLWIDTCERLSDVSPLYGIPFLTLDSCPEVQDISGLGNHERLRISRCAYDLQGYHILDTVRDISLEACAITDVSMMRKARVVELRNLPNLKDVSTLANVRQLTLVNCKEVEDINMLHNVKVLWLGSLPALRRYDGLECHPKLTLSYDQSGDMSTLTKFPGAKKLYLNKIDFSDFALLRPSFSRLMFLSLSTDENIELKGCEDIHTVHLNYCANITSTKGLGRNRQVKIVVCDMMKDVSHLANVPIVTIWYCRKVVNVSCLAKVPRLKILHSG